MNTAPPELLAHPDYEFLRSLGKGGMGNVFLVRNRLLDRQEVLKVVSPATLARPEARRRFLQEIRAAASLHHPNVVTAFAAVRLGEAIGFAMEHVDGDDLDQLVKRNGPLPVDAACRYLAQVCQGLQHAHERGMVHRDIKPANLIRSRADGRTVIKVLDFGLAKAVSEEPADNGLTMLGQVIGTPAYMAPEQIKSAPTADTRADLYAVGCVLYFLLTGKPPHPGPTMYEYFHAHRNLQPPSLIDVRPDAPPGLAAVASKLLHKEPGKRFQTPGEVADALGPFARPTGVSERVQVPGVGSPLPDKTADSLVPGTGPTPMPTQPLIARPVNPSHPRLKQVSGSRQTAPTAHLDRPAADDPISRRKRRQQQNLTLWLLPAGVFATILLLLVILIVVVARG
jgi:serine/threonine protein kinase